MPCPKPVEMNYTYTCMGLKRTQRFKKEGEINVTNIECRIGCFSGLIAV
jgi:hypothetical protein